MSTRLGDADAAAATTVAMREALARPIVGTPAVRKTTSAPLVVPAELRATSRALYSVPGVSPASVSETATAPRPEPALLTTVEVPYDVVVPSSNHQFVERPTGSTLPVRTTLTPVTCGWPVVASGPALVVKDLVFPAVVAASLRARRR